MAASYVNVTINGQTKEAIIVDGTGATERVILRSFLSAYDETQMDKVSLSAGATFFDKMQATTLKNGQTADVQYEDYIVFTEAYSDVVAKAQNTSSRLDAVETKNDEQDVTLADHEARITTLEP